MMMVTVLVFPEAAREGKQKVWLDSESMAHLAAANYSIPWLG